MSTPRRQAPNTPLRCSRCGGMKVRVFAIQQELRRTFRRVGAQAVHLHAACRCLNPECRHEWWSAHEMALEASQNAQAKGVDSQMVWTKRVEQDPKQSRRRRLSALLATAGHTANTED